MSPATETGKEQKVPRVFISYSKSDREVAEKICSALASNGICYWFAGQNILPGDEWLNSTFDAVDAAEILVLILSSDTDKSKWVEIEINLALDKNIKIIPFRVEEFSPQGIFRALMVKFQGINAFTPPLEKHLDRLVSAIKTHLHEDKEISANAA